MAESSNTGPTRDFSFVVRPPTVLKKAVDALSEPTFNSKEQVMIQVGAYGFEITVVEFTDMEHMNKIFGYFRLKATGLEEFQCNIPFEKMVSLKLMDRLLKDPSKNDYGALMIYSVSGSKKLYFQWGREVGFELPICIKLNNVRAGQERFPTVVDYGFEAVIPSNILNDSLTELLRSRRKPTFATATLIAPRVHIILDNKITLSTEEEAEKHEVWFGWKYWESLQKATLLADKCSMYLIKGQPKSSEYVMLRFKVVEGGDLVYLIPAKFLSDNTLKDLPSLGFFRPLKTLRPIKIPLSFTN